MSLSSQKKKEDISFTVFLLKGNLSIICDFFSMYSVLNRLLEYTDFYIEKIITSYTFGASF